MSTPASNDAPTPIAEALATASPAPPDDRQDRARREDLAFLSPCAPRVTQGEILERVRRRLDARCSPLMPDGQA